MLLERFKKTKKEADEFPAPLAAEHVISADLPPEFERFRTRSEPSIQPRQETMSQPSDYQSVPYGRPNDSIMAESAKIDKVDLILQKLETIDARLRFLEEKMRKF